MTIQRNSKGRPAQLFLEAERLEARGEFKSAFERLLAAAGMGHVMSQLQLGNFYAWGRGVRRDHRKAAQWYRKAYANGDRDGAHNLGIEKRNQGSYRAAVFWLERAVRMGSGESCVELAKMYVNRRGGRKLAEKLLTKATTMSRNDISELGREEAHLLLRRLRSDSPQGKPR